LAKRGRQPGFEMSNEHRVKIQNSNILNALIEHAEGKREMSPTQVTAGLGLLRKALPDLTAVEHSGEVTTRHEDALEQLDRPAAGDSAEAQGQSTALRSELPEDTDQGRYH
jgi:hypothetical protein